MDNRFESMPKNVQKLIRRLANIQRKEIALLRSGNENGEEPKDFEKKMGDLFFKGSKAIEELFDTRFAAVDMGIGWDEDDSYADELHTLGSYFLGLYTMNRMAAEVLGGDPDEDLFYAGALLTHRALLTEENDMDPDDDFDDVDTDEDTDEEEPLLDSLVDYFGDEPLQEEEKKVVPLFSEKKSKNV